MLKTVLGPGNVVLPGGSVEVGSDDDGAVESVTVTAIGLPALSTGRYEVRLFSRDGGSFTPVQGLVSVDGGDEVRAPTFASEEPGSTITITVDAEAGADLNGNSHVVVAMAEAADTEFLFAEYRDVEGSGVDGDLTFAGFDGPDANHRFLVAGSGEGRFIGDRLEVELKRVSPDVPEGFHYQSYLIAVEGAEQTMVQRLHTIGLDEIGNGIDVISESEAGGGFGAFNFYALVLEPDAAPALTRMEIQISEDYVGRFSDFLGQ